MNETTRINLVVGDDIPDLLTQLAGGERKRGSYITQLIRAVHAGELEGRAGSDLEQLYLAMTGLAAKQLAQESRLLHLEQRVTEMIGKG